MKFIIAYVVALCGLAFAAPQAAAQETKPAKLKVLFITGGGWHDYKALTPLLTGKLAELVNAEFVVNWEEGILKDPHLGDGYDAIIYDMCYDGHDPNTYSKVLEVTKAGKPAIFVHCAMHCYKVSGPWSEMVGMTTHRHDPYAGFSTTKLDKKDPIIKDWPDDWKTAGDELYNTDAINADTKSLLQAKSPADGKVHVVAWTHTYGSGRVFGTTLGHDMKTAALPEYHRLLANGLLWACGKLDNDGKPAAGYAGPGPGSSPSK